MKNINFKIINLLLFFIIVFTFTSNEQSYAHLIKGKEHKIFGKPHKPLTCIPFEERHQFKRIWCKDKMKNHSLCKEDIHCTLIKLEQQRETIEQQDQKNKDLEKKLGDMTVCSDITFSHKTSKKSKIYRKPDSKSTIVEELNNGDWFYAKYDRTHDLSFLMAYQIHPRLTLSSVFVYATGNSITLPSERYVIGGNVYTEYTSRNGYRMDPYHRLDIGATYTPKKKRKYESTWNFSIYNLYSRKNPYFIYLAIESNVEGEDGSIQDGNVSPKAYQVSIFPILPSITWNFSF